MAIKKRTEPPADLFVQAGDTIFLTIDIGNAQIGGSILKFEDEPTVFEKGKIKNLETGRADDLIGRTLKITSNVLDSNSSTNKIAITHRFKKAVPDAFQYFDTVNNDGDILSLSTRYNFKNQIL